MQEVAFCFHRRRTTLQNLPQHSLWVFDDLLRKKKGDVMKVRIMFDWAGNIYEWIIDWGLPFLPTVGDTFALMDFVEKGIIKDFKDVKFRGVFRYDGLEKNISGMFINSYNTRVVGRTWNADIVEIEIATNLFDATDENGIYLWKDVKNIS